MKHNYTYYKARYNTNFFDIYLTGISLILTAAVRRMTYYANRKYDICSTVSRHLSPGTRTLIRLG